MPEKKAIIIGAGPAGLTAAYELLHRTDIKPVVFEADSQCGGISKTVEYKGNRLDIGGHRFFSKSNQILKWWFEILPLEDLQAQRDDKRSFFEKILIAMIDREGSSSDPKKTDEVMILRRRLSRIFFLKRFFNYPITISLLTIKDLGLRRVACITASYLKARALPIRPEKSLEDFYINRFGRKFYKLFFKGYTEKVWGVPCNQIGTDWGRQRIKGLSLSRAIKHALRVLLKLHNREDIKERETSLIEQFLYPKFGPGQLWEKVAQRIIDKGGEIHYGQRVVGIFGKENQIQSLNIYDQKTRVLTRQTGDYFLSSMPVCDLIKAFGALAPVPVQKVAQGLAYVDFITVGMVYKQLKMKGKNRSYCPNGLIPDNWIYVQEPNVKIGRIQIYNNWSPFLVNNPKQVLLGIEFFCREGDSFWNSDDQLIINKAISELKEMGFALPEDFVEAAVIRMSKAYPAYFGTYDQFSTIRDFTDSYENLFLIGRNGMHRYNNQDHSMITAMQAVENIYQGKKDKSNIWKVNADDVYQETR